MSQSNAISNSITLKGIDLSHMPEVKIQEAPGKRSYGRRFVVILDGKASDEMVLKKILKQIKKFSKIDKSLTQEEKLTQLKSTKNLLEKLKSANIAATENYERRGNWYKFRTWFHRFGNKGTHEENIAKLETKIEEKINTIRDELDHPFTSNASTSPIEVFIEENLAVFQSFLDKVLTRKTVLNLRMHGHDVVINDSQSILIKKCQESLKISFSDGKIFKIESNDADSHTIPDHFKPLLRKIFENFITKASSYKYRLRIVQSSLKEFPVWHLTKLSKNFLFPKIQANKQYHFDIGVTFLDDNLETHNGADAGGLKRAYVNTLVESLQNQKSLFLETQDGLKCPRIERDRNCSKKEEQIYFNLGILMRCIYNSEKMTTGVYFNDILFNTALNFDFAELQTPFSDLPKDVLIRLARELVQTIPFDPESKEKQNMLLTLDLCNKDYLDNCLDQLDQKVALKEVSTAALVGLMDDGMEAYLEDNFINANIEAIKENRKGFIDQLYSSIFSNKQFITQLKSASLDQILSPIHNIARGISVNDEDSWNKLKSNGYQDLGLKIQGEMDRQLVCNSFLMMSFNKKDLSHELNWLKEWILKEATNEDIKNFLKFVSGSTSLPIGKKIWVGKQNVGKFPTANTCSIEIELSGQNTSKESFIEKLKEAILVSDFRLF